MHEHRKLSKPEVGYVVSAEGSEHCRTCWHYQGDLCCAIVAGLVLRAGWCRRWTETAKAA